MPRKKLLWTCVLVLFAVATFAINYQVKVRMHEDGRGSVPSTARFKVGAPAPDFVLS